MQMLLFAAGDLMVGLVLLSAILLVILREGGDPASAAPLITATLAPPTLQTPATSTATPGGVQETTGTPDAAPSASAPNAQRHTVAPNETLTDIAARYHVSIEAIRLANGLSDPNTIQAGQVLLIPAPGETPAVTLTPAADPAAYEFSILDGGGNLAEAYSLTRAGDNFTVHYPAGSFAEQNIDAVIADIRAARAHIEMLFGVTYGKPFDVYLAGSLFAPPDQNLRGRAFSAKHAIFVLYDGSGTPAERRYMLTHELTHLIAWNTFGQPKSAMLSEGAAVYAGEQFLLAEAFVPVRQLCLVYRRANMLPHISSPNLQFLGHLFHLDTYYAGGCFTQFVLEQYGSQKFGAVYHTLDFQGVYGQNLGQLEQAWLTDLDTDQTALPFTAEQWSSAYQAVLDDYHLFLDAVTPETFDPEVYRALDRRRIRIMQGFTE